MKRKTPHYNFLVDSTDQDMAEVLQTVSRKVERSLAKAQEIHQQRLKGIHSSKAAEQVTQHA